MNGYPDGGMVGVANELYNGGVPSVAAPSAPDYTPLLEAMMSRKKKKGRPPKDAKGTATMETGGGFRGATRQYQPPREMGFTDWARGLF